MPSLLKLCVHVGTPRVQHWRGTLELYLRVQDNVVHLLHSSQWRLLDLGVVANVGAQPTRR